MNSCSFRMVLLANTLALMAGSMCGKTGRGVAPAQTVSIHLYDQAQAPGEVLHLAIDEATRLLRAAGIGTVWERPSAESPQDQGTDMTSTAFRQQDERRYIVLRLMRRTSATIFPGALGFALPFAHTGAHVLIFYDRVEALTPGVNTATYIILGHAMAHEIGHVLLRSSEHSAGGLMQARWTPASWQLASAGLLAFRREEAERMSAGLARFQALEIMAKHESTFGSSMLQHSPEQTTKQIQDLDTKDVRQRIVTNRGNTRALK